MSYLELKNVTKSYNDRIIFKDLNMNVEKGKFISIIGSFGIGKSTLLKIISGLEEINSGKIIINNKSVKTLKKDNKIGFAFQEPMLLPWRTVYDNINLPCEIKKIDKKNKIENLLKKVDLFDKEKVYPSELSGGMQRIVSILRSIVLEPSILLLDEPFSSIDEINRDDLHEKLISLQQEKKITTILVTHSIHEAVYLSDEIYILGNSPTEIIKKIKIHNPRNKDKKFSEETLDKVNEIKKELRKVIKNA